MLKEIETKKGRRRERGKGGREEGREGGRERERGEKGMREGEKKGMGYYYQKYTYFLFLLAKCQLVRVVLIPEITELTAS